MILKKLPERFEELCRGMNDRETAEELLTWLQGFEYGSTTKILGSSVSSSKRSSAARGDCDALALVYALLLNRMDIPSGIMVSRHISVTLWELSSVSGERRPVLPERGELCGGRDDKKRRSGTDCRRSGGYDPLGRHSLQDSYNEGTLAYGE